MYEYHHVPQPFSADLPPLPPTTTPLLSSELRVQDLYNIPPPGVDEVEEHYLKSMKGKVGNQERVAVQ